MATSADYLAFVLEQLPPLWDVRSRKMFGEYMVYLNEKPVLLVCDNTVFVKKLPVLDDLMRDAPCGCPYEGAKEHYMLDVEDRELCCCTDCLAGAFVYAGEFCQRGVQGRSEKRRLLRVLFAREKGSMCEQ